MTARGAGEDLAASLQGPQAGSLGLRAWRQEVSVPGPPPGKPQPSSQVPAPRSTQPQTGSAASIPARGPQTQEMLAFLRPRDNSIGVGTSRVSIKPLPCSARQSFQGTLEPSPSPTPIIPLRGGSVGRLLTAAHPATPTPGGTARAKACSPPLSGSPSQVTGGWDLNAKIFWPRSMRAGTGTRSVKLSVKERARWMSAEHWSLADGIK